MTKFGAYFTHFPAPLQVIIAQSLIKMLTYSLLGIIGIYLYSFTNNELEIFNTARGFAECGIEISRLLLVNSCR